MSGALLARRPPPARRGPAVAVEVLVCGSPDRGDDGAPMAVMGRVRGQLPPDVTMRAVGQLDVDDLLSVPFGAGVVIVDAATGIDPGGIVDLALTGLIGRSDGVHPRSSHALTLPEVVGLAEMLRGRPLNGRIVAIGGVHFGLGSSLSRPVNAALDQLSEAIVSAAASVRPAASPARPASPPDGDGPELAGVADRRMLGPCASPIPARSSRSPTARPSSRPTSDDAGRRSCSPQRPR
jgi:hydrogenase maturation protease